MNLYSFLKDNAQSIQYWGLGFIQVKLTDDINYHFWIDSLPTTFDSDIPHNHFRDFQSVILYGEIEETVYSFREDDHGEFSCKENKCTFNDLDKKRYSIDNIDSYVHIEGDTYFRCKDELHTVDPKTTLAITMVTKVGERGIVYSMACNDIKEPMKYDVSENDLWAFVYKACKEACL